MSGRDTNFYYSFLVLPAEKRRAIVAVWDFCRAVDDAVDEDPADLPAEHETTAPSRSWRAGGRRLAACYGEGPRPKTAQGRRLAPFIKRFKPAARRVRAVIDGVAMDLEQTRYETFDDLQRYCLRVASAVGLICLEIFGYRDPRDAPVRGRPRHRAAADQHRARRARPTSQRGRIYLPADDLWRFEVEEKDLAAGIVTPHVTDLLAFQCRRARMYYEKAERSCRGATGAACWPRASWAASTAGSSSGSKRPATTCSRGRSACRGRAAR